jgi:hypothetical protein
MRRAAITLCALAALLAPATHARAQTAPSRAASAPVCAASAPACAASAPIDTTLDGYVRSMADSTDAWFGLSAQPADTTGLDSARVERLAHPRKVKTTGGHVALGPWLDFSRVLGPAYGADVSIGPARGIGRLGARAQFAAGPDSWLGGGEYLKRWAGPADEDRARLRVSAGRAVESMDRDFAFPALGTVRALLWGADREHYLRRDGTRAQLAYRASAWWAGAGARAERESPLATTAGWHLFGHRPLAIAYNDSAAGGRVHEFDVYAGVRLPRWPIVLDAQVWRAGGGLGGDLAYVRTRLTAGAALALGSHLTLAPQADYGRLTGAALPQDAFTLSGSTLRTLDTDRAHGTGRAAGHVDLILNDPLQRLLRIDPRPTFPVQLGAFAGAAACWGTDAATGRAALTARDWPASGDWACEAGVSLLYRPGVPRPDSFVRLDWAHPLGSSAGRAATYVSYTTPLNFLRGR